MTFNCKSHWILIDDVRLQYRFLTRIQTEPFIWPQFVESVVFSPSFGTEFLAKRVRAFHRRHRLIFLVALIQNDFPIGFHRSCRYVIRFTSTLCTDHRFKGFPLCRILKASPIQCILVQLGLNSLSQNRPQRIRRNRLDFSTSYFSVSTRPPPPPLFFLSGDWSKGSCQTVVRL